MNVNKAFQFLLIIIISAFVSPGIVLAKDNAFYRIQLKNKVSIEIPNHWYVIPQDSRLNIRAASESMVSNAKVPQNKGSKETLLAVNSMPNPTGAIIRNSITTQPEYTQSDLKAATPSELELLRSEFLVIFKKLESSGGPKILEMYTPKIERINDHLALVLAYTRNSLVGPSPWLVTQYKIPMANYLIEMTLSHRVSDAPIWKPILERVKQSMRF